MAYPKLTRVNVRISYSADDGFSSEVGFRGSKKTPEADLMAAIEELSRLAALFGFEDRAFEVFDSARARVFEWRKQRTAPNVKVTGLPHDASDGETSNAGCGRSGSPQG